MFERLTHLKQPMNVNETKYNLMQALFRYVLQRDSLNGG